MEGLIPYIYRSIKRRKDQQYLRSMSTGPSRFFGVSNAGSKILRPPPIELGGHGEDQNGHRRQRSMEEYSSSSELSKVGRHGLLTKGGGFGSCRVLVSCVSGTGN